MTPPNLFHTRRNLVLTVGAAAAIAATSLATTGAPPPIGVPTITPEGDTNGAPHPDPQAHANKFSGRYTHRLITSGIGHNLPQEAPNAFAQAVVDVTRT